MIVPEAAKKQILIEGFAVIENVFTAAEVNEILRTLSTVDGGRENVRRSAGLFAIRQVLKEAPDLIPLVYTPSFLALITELFGEGYRIVKSIYFDKPGQSNWFVSYHQDLTISVDKKMDAEGFTAWTAKPNDFSVQPPVSLLEDNFTVRIHLDDTDEDNGALRVIPLSHRKGIIKPEGVDRLKETEVFCCVPKGGVMVMKPLLLHASSRTTNNASRRVLHLEFSRQSLPGSLDWAECFEIKRGKTAVPKDTTTMNGHT